MGALVTLKDTSLAFSWASCTFGMASLHLIHGDVLQSSGIFMLEERLLCSPQVNTSTQAWHNLHSLTYRCICIVRVKEFHKHFWWKFFFFKSVCDSCMCLKMLSRLDQPQQRWSLGPIERLSEILFYSFCSSVQKWLVRAGQTLVAWLLLQGQFKLKINWQIVYSYSGDYNCKLNVLLTDVFCVCCWDKWNIYVRQLYIPPACHCVCCSLQNEAVEKGYSFF